VEDALTECGSEPVQPEPDSGSSGTQIGAHNVRIDDATIVVGRPERAGSVRRRTLLMAAGGVAAAGGVSALALAIRVLARQEPRRGTGQGGATAGGRTQPGNATKPSPEVTVAPPGPGPTAVEWGHPLAGNGGTVFSVAFSPDGRTLASGDGDWNTRLWDVTVPARAVQLGDPLAGHDDTVYAVAFSPYGHLLASGGAVFVLLWNVTNPARPALAGSREQAIGALNTIYSVAFSPDGHSIAVGTQTDYPGENPDPTYLWLWDVTDPANPRGMGDFPGHQGPVFSVAFSPDGRTLASGSEDQTIRLWDVTDPVRPTSLGQPLARQPGYIYSVAFSRDSRILASGSSNQMIQLWDVTDPARPAPLGQALTGHSGYVYSVAFSPDGKTLASGGADQTILLWDVADPARPSQPGQAVTGHNGHVLSVAFSPDGRTLASGSADQTIRLWRIT